MENTISQKKISWATNTLPYSCGVMPSLPSSASPGADMGESWMSASEHFEMEGSDSAIMTQGKNYWADTLHKGSSVLEIDT